MLDFALPPSAFVVACGGYGGEPQNSKREESENRRDKRVMMEQRV
jgi:hypothetical protein